MWPLIPLPPLQPRFTPPPSMETHFLIFLPPYLFNAMNLMAEYEYIKQIENYTLSSGNSCLRISPSVPGVLPCLLFNPSVPGVLHINHSVPGVLHCLHFNQSVPGVLHCLHINPSDPSVLHCLRIDPSVPGVLHC